MDAVLRKARRQYPATKYWCIPVANGGYDTVGQKLTFQHHRGGFPNPCFLLGTTVALVTKKQVFPKCMIVDAAAGVGVTTIPVVTKACDIIIVIPNQSVATIKESLGMTVLFDDYLTAMPTPTPTGTVPREYRNIFMNFFPYFPESWKKSKKQGDYIQKEKKERKCFPGISVVNTPTQVQFVVFRNYDQAIVVQAGDDLVKFQQTLSRALLQALKQVFSSGSAATNKDYFLPIAVKEAEEIMSKQDINRIVTEMNEQGVLPVARPSFRIVQVRTYRVDASLVTVSVPINNYIKPGDHLEYNQQTNVCVEKVISPFVFLVTIPVSAESSTISCGGKLSVTNNTMEFIEEIRHSGDLVGYRVGAKKFIIKDTQAYYKELDTGYTQCIYTKKQQAILDAWNWCFRNGVTEKTFQISKETLVSNLLLTEYNILEGRSTLYHQIQEVTINEPQTVTMILYNLLYQAMLKHSTRLEHCEVKKQPGEKKQIVVHFFPPPNFYQRNYHGKPIVEYLTKHYKLSGKQIMFEQERIDQQQRVKYFQIMVDANNFRYILIDILLGVLKLNRICISKNFVKYFLQSLTRQQGPTTTLHSLRSLRSLPADCKILSLPGGRKKPSSHLFGTALMYNERSRRYLVRVTHSVNHYHVSTLDIHKRMEQLQTNNNSSIDQTTSFHPRCVQKLEEKIKAFLCYQKLCSIAQQAAISEYDDAHLKLQHIKKIFGDLEGVPTYQQFMKVAMFSERYRRYIVKHHPSSSTSGGEKEKEIQLVRNRINLLIAKEQNVLLEIQRKLPFEQSISWIQNTAMRPPGQTVESWIQNGILTDEISVHFADQRFEIHASQLVFEQQRRRQAFLRAETLTLMEKEVGEVTTELTQQNRRFTEEGCPIGERSLPRQLDTTDNLVLQITQLLDIFLKEFYIHANVFSPIYQKIVNDCRKPFLVLFTHQRANDLVNYKLCILLARIYLALLHEGLSLNDIALINSLRAYGIRYNPKNINYLVSYTKVFYTATQGIQLGSVQGLIRICCSYIVEFQKNSDEIRYTILDESLDLFQSNEVYKQQRYRGTAALKRPLEKLPLPQQRMCLPPRKKKRRNGGNDVTTPFFTRIKELTANFDISFLATKSGYLRNQWISQNSYPYRHPPLDSSMEHLFFETLKEKPLALHCCIPDTASLEKIIFRLKQTNRRACLHFTKPQLQSMVLTFVSKILKTGHAIAVGGGTGIRLVHVLPDRSFQGVFLSLSAQNLKELFRGMYTKLHAHYYRWFITHVWYKKEYDELFQQQKWKNTPIDDDPENERDQLLAKYLADLPVNKMSIETIVQKIALKGHFFASSEVSKALQQQIHQDEYDHYKMQYLLFERGDSDYHLDYALLSSGISLLSPRMGVKGQKKLSFKVYQAFQEWWSNKLLLPPQSEFAKCYDIPKLRNMVIQSLSDYLVKEQKEFKTSASARIHQPFRSVILRFFLTQLNSLTPVQNRWEIMDHHSEAAALCGPYTSSTSISDEVTMNDVTLIFGGNNIDDDGVESVEEYLKKIVHICSTQTMIQSLLSAAAGGTQVIQKLTDLQPSLCNLDAKKVYTVLQKVTTRLEAKRQEEKTRKKQKEKTQLQGWIREIIEKKLEIGNYPIEKLYRAAFDTNLNNLPGITEFREMLNKRTMEEEMDLTTEVLPEEEIIID